MGFVTPTAPAGIDSNYGKSLGKDLCVLALLLVFTAVEKTMV